jgi:nucleoside-diphosphate-sugar epimerase
LRVLVTGGGGFLGGGVVRALLDRSHQVRALLRSSGPPDTAGRDVEAVRADLRIDELAPAVEGTDVVVHVAAGTKGGEAQQFASTVVGTERLVAAMVRAQARHLVLASSFTVYDWEAPRETLDEETPLVADPTPRGAYTAAKLWQERVARRTCADAGIALTVLRPGVIWGPGNEHPAGITAKFGNVQVVVGLRARLPLTYVVNCANAFADAAEARHPAGETFNVVDDEGVPTWRFVGEVIRRTGVGRRVPVPYGLAHAAVRGLRFIDQRWLEGRALLPSVLDEPRFVARFRPLRYSNAKLRRFGWRPDVTFDDALEATYGPPRV